MASLKATLEEAEARAQKAEDELKNANERAEAVSIYNSPRLFVY